MSFSLDFNHGMSGRAMVLDGDISDAVNAYVDAAFAAKRAAEPARDYIGASSIGNDCLRAVQLQRLGIPPDHPPEGKILRIWETGHVFEREIANWLRMAGFDLDVLDPETGKQFTWRTMDEEGGGSIDGIIRGGPLPLAYPFLWECKALKASSWQATKKKGLAISKPYYAKQFAINQGYLDLLNPGVFTALNKDTSELYHARVAFDQPLAQNASDDMVRVVEANEAHILLPRAFNEPEHFKCRMCPHAVTCWEKLK